MSHFFDQAVENEKFLNNLNSSFPDDHFDWKITVSFYTCLQYAKAYALKYSNKTLNSDHNAIKVFLEKNTKNFVYSKYSILRKESEIVRYMVRI